MLLAGADGDLDDRVWAEIDARDGGAVDATTTVAGLPLITRLVRQLARAGFAGAMVVCADAAARRRLHRVLDRSPGPGSFPVEVAVGAPARPTAIAIDGRGVYLHDELGRARRTGERPTPLLVVRSTADRRVALRTLFRALGKSVERDGWFSYHVTRPAARWLTRGLLPTAVTPNQVTLAAMACGLAAAACAARGAVGAIAAGALLIAGMLLDNVDGDLARLRLQFSRAGEWLDAIADEVVTLGVTAALGVGLVRDGAAPWWCAAALAAVGVGGVALVAIYGELARRGGVIDTAVFPWFFRGGAARTDGGAGRAARWRPRALLTALELVMRRDVYVTAVATLVMLDCRRIALALLVLGLGGLALAYLVHVAVSLLAAARR